MASINSFSSASESQDIFPKKLYIYSANNGPGWDKPMKNRILSVVLAISMIAVVFSAVPTRAEVTDTGVVTATDSTNFPKSVFIQGELIYFDVKTVHLGEVDTRPVTVTLGTTGVHQHVTTNATTGWYNSSTATPITSLDTGGLFLFDRVQAYDVIATVGGEEIARYPVVVKKEGVFLDPPTANYWPGLTVTWTLVTAHMAEGLYVQILNGTAFDTFHATIYNTTAALVPDGFKTGSFTVGQWKDGTYYLNVRFALNDDFLYTATFTVAKYSFVVSAERTWFLPGETAVIDYSLLSMSGGGIPSGVVINYWAQWWELNSTMDPVKKWQNSSLLTSETEQLFAIPTTIALNHSPAVHIDYWANATTNGSIHSSVDLHVDVISASVSLSTMGSVAPGDTIQVTVDAFVNSPNVLPGANVNVTVTLFGNTTQEFAVYGATGLVTDLSGTVGYSFVLASDAARGTYVVKATVSKLGFSTSREATFTVANTFSLTAVFDKPYYYGGEKVTVTFEAQWNRAPIPTGVISYMIDLEGKILAVANTTSTSVSVDLPTEVPEGTDTLEVHAAMIYLGYMLTGSDSADTIASDLSLAAAKSEYRAGDTITWSWSIVTGLSTATLTWEIFDSHGVRVEEGNPTFAKTGSFKFSVPKENPAVYYAAVMRMSSTTGSPLVEVSFVDLVASLEFRAWVDKSPYADGMFAPGGELKIKYSITAVTADESGRPAYRIHVTVENDPIELDVLTSKSSGEITYKVPKTASAGQLNIEVELTDAATGDSLGTSSTTFVVNNRESAWDRSLGGMSISDLLILILLVVVILVLIIMPYMKGRMGKPKAPEPVPPPAPSTTYEPGKMPPSP